MPYQIIYWFNPTQKKERNNSISFQQSEREAYKRYVDEIRPNGQTKH